MVSIVLKELSKDVFHLEFPTLHLMCSTMIRFQEHYECPKFKGKIFTLEEYMDWYANRFGDFVYFQEVAGFNIPADTLDEFYNGKFNPLTKKEKLILKTFEHYDKPYYIIATSSQSATQQIDLVHEISHGLFYTNKEYNKAVRKIMKVKDIKEIYEWLKGKGYHRRHFFDEAHALLLEDAKSFNRCGMKASDYREIRKKLRDNYNKHYFKLNNKIKRIRIPK